MNINDQRRHQREAESAVDELIRRRFRSCETLPLFAERPAPPGFFQPPHTGEQLFLDVRRRRLTDTAIRALVVR